jgi:hypothetical protein
MLPRSSVYEHHLQNMIDASEGMPEAALSFVVPGFPCHCCPASLLPLL